MKNIALLLLLNFFWGCTGGGGASVDAFLGLNKPKEDSKKVPGSQAIAYDAKTFNEAAINNGSMGNYLTISGTGIVFASSTDYVADGKIIVTDVPAGLTAKITNISGTQLKFELINNATSHSSANDTGQSGINNLTVQFTDSAFSDGSISTDVIGSKVTDVKVKYNLLSVTYTPGTFTEAVLNNGTFSGGSTIDVGGDTFTGLNGDDYIAAGKVVVTNVPAGLTANIQKIGATQLLFTLTGTALSHLNANDVNNLTVTFADSAFTLNLAVVIANSTKSDLQIDFKDPAILNYLATGFTEAVDNLGDASSFLGISLANETLTGIDGDEFIAAGKATIANIPAGLTATLVRINNGLIKLVLTGNATSHADINDAFNITVNFANSAFTGNNVSLVANASKNDIEFDFMDPYNLTYSASTFTESSANGGAIGNSITITLAGTSFTGGNGSNFVAAGKVAVTNLPAGLTAVVTKSNSSTLVATFTGSAAAHANVDDIANLTFTFANTAFTSGAATGVTNYLKNNFAVDFNDPAVLTYSASTFNETAANTGASTSTFDIDLVNDTYTGTNGEDYIATGKIVATNVPAGMTAVVTKTSNTKLTASLSGNATAHANANDVGNLTLTFAATSFTINSVASNVTNYAKNNITIDFIDLYTLSYSTGTFAEALANNGAIGNTSVLTLTGTTFTGLDGAFAGGKYAISNLPSGLTLSINKDSATQLTVTISGTATSHANANDIANLTIAFAGSAFTSTAAAGVTNATKSNLIVDYNDPVNIAWSATTFSESTTNIGAITNQFVLTLTTDTFTGTNGAFAAGNFVAANVPAGLTLSINRDSNTQLTVTLSGSATAHANANDIANLSLSFNDSAFTTFAAAVVIDSAKTNLVVDYLDPYILTYSAATFTESSANGGAVSNSLTLTLSGGAQFTGANGNDFVASKVLVTNVPLGLTATAIRNSATTMTLALTGTAIFHTGSDDIANLTFTFQNTAFDTNAALGVTNYAKNNIIVDFNDAAILAYSASTFTESTANTGASSTTFDIDITNDTYTGTNGENYIATGKIVATNVPAGMTAVVTKISNTKLTASLSGSATSHANANDVANLTLTFAATSFTNNTDATTVTNYAKNNIIVDFADPYTLTYSTATFSEALTNTGTISNTITLTLAGTTFTGVNADNFVSATKVAVSNLPAGFTAVATRTSATTIDLTLTGTAASHANANDVANLTFAFANSAFTSGAAIGVTNYNKNDVVINFNDPTGLTWSTNTFAESVANIGAITTSMTITLSNDTYTGGNGTFAGTKYTAANVPAGLTLSINKDSATQLTATLTGNATAHANANDIANMEITFNDTAFTIFPATSISNYTQTAIVVDYVDPYSIAYSTGTFTESTDNNGSIPTSVTATITGTTFTGADASNYISATKVAITNVPAGLTAVATKTSATVVTINFTGTATAHANANDIANLTVTFADSAFTSGAAAGVTTATKADFIVDYREPVSLTYSAATLSEATANTGAITGSVNIDIANDTYTGTNGEDYIATTKVVATNVPAGLTAVLTKSSATRLVLSFSGSATAHANTNDVSNVTLTFAAGSFTTSTVAANVTNYAKNDFALDFADPYSIAYGTATFAEAIANNGSIGNTSVLTLTGTTLTGADGVFAGAKYAVSNLPAGLTLSINKDSSTQLTVTLSGTATSHANANDIANLTIAFADGAFTSGAAAGVTNATKSNLVVNFNDPVAIAWSATTFSENLSNLGTISNTSVLTLTNDTFTGADGAFAGSKFAAANVPAGLTLSINKDSNTQLTVTLSGTATLHANANDIANLSLTFNDTAFSTYAAAVITDYTKTNLLVDYLDAYSLSYSGATFNESTANGGVITNSITLTLSGGVQFTGSNSDDFVGTKVTVLNTPVGLTATAIRSSATTMTLALTGTATSHANADDIANLTVTFADNAFNSAAAAGVTNYTRNDLVVNFNDPASLSYGSGTFNEMASNNGQITNSIVLTLVNDTFTGTNGVFTGTKYSASGVPTGLSLSINRDSNTQVTVSLTGTAAAHENINDISNLGLTFDVSAFTTSTVAASVVNYSRTDIGVNFLDAYTLTYSGTSFTEALTNNGAVTGTRTITLTGSTFAAGTDFISETKASVSGVPTGLTAVLTRTSATVLTLSFTGTASPHNDSADISVVGLTFNNSAFTNGNAAGVTGYTRADLSFDFTPPGAITYSSATFVEAAANNGTIDNALTLTLVNDTFTGANGAFSGSYSSASVPTGLTVAVTKVSSTELSVTLTGTAGSHANANDISSMVLTFNNSSFTSGTASAVTNYTKTNLVVDFTDTPLPNISSITIPSNATYLEGQNLDFTVNYDETVAVTGTPRLTLVIGATTKYATYVSGTGTSAITFRYLVEAGMTDSDGIALTQSIDLNGGTILGVNAPASRAADLTFTSAATTGILVLDGPPVVASVTSPTANSSYGLGQQVQVQVVFNEIVNVASGSPRILLETGATDRYATYVSGTGTTTLLFVYTILAGDINADLDYQSTTAIDLNGSTIRDVGSNNATLTLAALGAANSLANNKNLNIDANPATITNITSAAVNGSFGVGQNIDVTVTFTKVVNVVGVPTLQLETGATDRLATYISGSGSTTLTFRYTVVAADINSDLDYLSTTALSAVTYNIPTDFTGLQLWLDANDTSKLFQNSACSTAVTANGQSVGCWLDKSTNAYPITQTTAGELPIYNTNSFSTTMPTLTFDGTNDSLDGGNIFNFERTDPRTIFVAHKGNGSNNGAVLSKMDHANNYQGWDLWKDANTTEMSFHMSSNWGANNATRGVYTSANNSESYTSYDYNGSSTVSGMGWSRNGSNLTLTTNVKDGLTSTIINNATTFSIGARNSTGGFYNGKISEVIIYNRQLSSVEKAAVETYLGQKWITANLPALATIKDANGNFATLTLPAPGAAGSLGANKNLNIDTAPATITNVTSSLANGTYGTGTNVDITVTFTKAVTVSGRAAILLETGAIDRYANYLSGTGTTQLVFRYTVILADTSSDLNYASTGALTLAGVLSPTNISGLKLWLDAQDLTTLYQDSGCSATAVAANNDPVGCWKDKSGNSKHSTQSTAGLRPLYKTGAYAKIAFDGADDYLDAGSTVLTGPVNNVEVLWAAENYVEDGTAWTLNNGGATSRIQVHTPWSNGSAYFDVGDTGGANRVSTAWGGTAGALNLWGASNTVAGNFQGLYKNGAILVSDATGHSVALVGNTLIGANVSGAEYAQMNLPEFMVYDHALTTAEREEVEGYLACKYSMQAQLPAPHSYKSVCTVTSTINDAAGNVATLTLPALGGAGSLAINKAIIIDSTPPATPTGLSLSVPAASPGNNATPTVLISGTETGATVGLYSAVGCASLLGTATAAGATTLVTATNLGANGAYTLYTKQTDPAGNASECFGPVAYTLDTVIPTITITTPVAAFKASATTYTVFTVAGACSENGRSVTVTATDGTTPVTTTPTCTTSAYTTNLNLTSLTDTAVTITANHTDAAGNAAAQASVAGTKDITVPTISSVNAPANAWYVLGQNLNFTVNFTEAVTVSGTRLPIVIGSTTVYANYLTGSGSSAIVYRYTVVANDLDTDGIATTATLDLNAGTISDGSNAATITFTNPTLTGVKVDAAIPTISSVTAPANATYLVTNNMDFTVNFSEAVTVTGSPRIPLTIGATPQYAVYVSGSPGTALIFRRTVVGGDVDADGIASASPIELNGGTILDPAANVAILTFTPPTTTGVLVSTAALITLSPTIFDFDSSINYTSSNGTYLDINTGLNSLARMLASDQTDDSTAGTGSDLGFQSGGASGTIGVTYNASDKIVLNTAGSDTNNSELDQSWTPQWSTLVSYWKHNEGSGATTLVDSVGANNGTVNGTITFDSAGKIGKSAVYNGTTGYVSIPNHASQDLQNSWTASAWVKPSGTVRDGDAIMSSTWGNTRVQFAIGGTGDVANISAGMFNGSWTKTAQYTPTIGEWILVTGVYQGGGSATLKLYINGTLYSSVAAPSSVSTSGAGMYIGHRWDASGTAFPGNIDDAALWSTALTQAQINTIYQRQFPKFAGTYVSRIMDGIIAAPTWNAFPFKTSLPFGKEIVASSEAGPVAYWKLDESNGSGTVADSVGANTGTVNGSLTLGTNGKYTTAGDFDGTDDYISIPSSASLTFSTASTVSTWFKPSRALTGEQAIVTSTVSAGTNVHFALASIQSAGGIKAGIYTGGWYTTTTYTPTIGEWVHLMGVYQGGTSPSIKLYVNGALFNTLTTGVPSSIPSEAVGVRIGRRWDNPDYVGGKIDDVGLWNRALSATEAQNIYTSGVMSGNYGTSPTDFATNLAGYWKFNGATYGTTANEITDASGNARHGQLNTAATTVSGVYGNALELNATSDTAGRCVTLPASVGTSMNGAADMTVSMWVRPRGLQYHANSSLFSMNMAAGNPRMRLEMDTANKLGVAAQTVNGGTLNEFYLGTAMPVGWNHVVAKITAGTGGTGSLTLWQNGVQTSNGYTFDNATFQWSDIVNVQIGCETTATRLSRNDIDNVIVWKRGLTNTEVQELYKRGVSRVKYQLRTCSASNCSDRTAAAPGWVGYDGTIDTYLSEINNTSDGTPTGTTLASTFTNAFSVLSSAYSGFSSWVTGENKRYFQYRVILESDDSTGTYKPDITYVKPGPDHYSNTAYSAVNTSTVKIPFVYLTAFSQTLGANGCASGVNYQLSVDGAAWKYWNGSAWAAVSGGTDYNTAAVVNTNIAAFASTFNPTTVANVDLYVKAFLASSGTSACELDALTLTGQKY